jgi:hypothetical protein
MSDLRTRIAEAIVGKGCPCTDCTGLALEKADAVIAELGLERQSGWSDEAIALGAPQDSHRYVTDWKADDE